MFLKLVSNFGNTELWRSESFWWSSNDSRRSRVWLESLCQAVRTVGSLPLDAWLTARSWRRSSSSTHTGTSSFQSGFGGELAGWICRRRLAGSGGTRRVSLLWEKNRFRKWMMNDSVVKIFLTAWCLGAQCSLFALLPRSNNQVVGLICTPGTFLVLALSTLVLCRNSSTSPR